MRRRPKPEEAVVTLEEILEAAGQFTGPVRSELHKFLEHMAGIDPEAALRCAGNASGVLHQLSPAQQSLYLSEALALAEVPAAAAEFFCCCADLVHFLDEKNLCSWARQGGALGLENPAAGAAFFRRESQAGLSFFEGLRRSVHIGQVDRALQLYCTAMAERLVGVKGIAEAPPELVRLGRHYPLTDGRTVFLPESLNKHPTHEENFEEYKVLAAHQAGYIEFGTFDLDVEDLRGHPALERLGREEPETFPLASHYELFFHLFEDRELARDVFLAVEDGRVDFRLRRKYRGLAGSLEKAALGSLEGRPHPSSLPLREALVESLVRFSLTGRCEETLPEGFWPLTERIWEAFSSVLSLGATVADSARAAADIYLLLGSLLNVSMDAPVFSTVIESVEGLPIPGPEGGAGQESGFPDGQTRQYQPVDPVFWRGQTSPELVQLEMAVEMMGQALADGDEEGRPLSKEMLEELIKSGAKIKITQMTAKELLDSQGLFVTDLKGLLQEKVKELSPEERRRLAGLLDQAVVVKSAEEESGRVFYYDEWDYHIDDYRPRWCKLREVPVEDGSAEVVARICREQSALIMAVRRQFQRIRPEMLHKVKRLPSGEDIDLDDAIEAVIDRRAGLTPSDRIYQQRDRRKRDVATAFLLDLSASTNEWIAEDRQAWLDMSKAVSRADQGPYSSGRVPEGPPEEFSPQQTAKRVIDVEREALVIMAEALEGLGDEYAIYGFSGYGRDNVEFLTIKDFSERYSERARCRIGALKSRSSTRMGPAIRHTLEKLAQTGCRLKVLILLSDGYPQDFDYGPDRMSRDYGLYDTKVALEEARGKNVHTFCVTVDQAGNDYLYDMCAGDNYLVVKRPSYLPRVLPRVYRGLTV